MKVYSYNSIAICERWMHDVGEVFWKFNDDGSVAK